MMQKRLLTRSSHFLLIYLFSQQTNKRYRYQYFCDSNMLDGVFTMFAAHTFAHLVYIFSLSAHLKCGFYFHTKASSLKFFMPSFFECIFSRIIFNWNSTNEFAPKWRCNYAHRYWGKEFTTMANKRINIQKYYFVYNQISQIVLIKLLNSNAPFTTFYCFKFLYWNMQNKNPDKYRRSFYSIASALHQISSDLRMQFKELQFNRLRFKTRDKCFFRLMSCNLLPNCVKIIIYWKIKFLKWFKIGRYFTAKILSRLHSISGWFLKHQRAKFRNSYFAHLNYALNMMHLNAFEIPNWNCSLHIWKMDKLKYYFFIVRVKLTEF